MSQLIEWCRDQLGVLTPFLAPTGVLAVVGSLIAFQQWRTNRARLKHELFDRRYEAYLLITQFMADIVTRGKVEPGAEITFLAETKKVYFLFDRRTSNFTQEIFKKSADLYALRAMQENLAGDQLKENVEKQRQLIDWFSSQIKSIEGRFKKFLLLKH